LNKFEVRFVVRKTYTGNIENMDTVDREGHDHLVVEEGDDQDHEQWEVKLVRKGEMAKQTTIRIVTAQP
jgi:hypothetical protein